MKNRKQMVSILAGIMAAVMILTLVLGLLPTKAYAASSSEIKKQIAQLKKDKEEIKGKIKEVQDDYKQNESEILDIIARKNVIDQEIQLLTTEITNINDQISAYNILIADKQDELDNAEGRYEQLNEENKVRVRTMEEEGEISYWEVLFKANSFSDLLDRLNMVEEIAASDKRRMQALSDAADEVGLAQDALNGEKADLEVTKSDLDRAEEELASKQAEAVDLFQQLLSRGDELEALKLEYEEQEQQFMEEIAQKQQEYEEAKLAEWEAYMATYVPPTQVGTPGDSSGGNNGGSSGGSSGGQGGSSGGGGWLRPCSYTSITSPFGSRPSPTAGASSNHLGVDLDTGTGWPVVATRAGIVTVAGWGNAAGNYVQIDHQDGFRSIYMHLSSIGVRQGQIVSGGQYIGATGATGVATGDHLHFGISYNGVYVNPCSYVAL